MTKKTTTDDLKALFAKTVDGKPEDWKRVSKKKNDEGLVVREFVNKHDGRRLIAAEKKDGGFSLEWNTQAAGAASANAKAGDEILAELLIARMEKDDGRISKGELKKAGAAIARRFVFAIAVISEDGDDNYCVHLATVKEHENRKYGTDRWATCMNFGAILPEGASPSHEFCYTFDAGREKSRYASAQDLMKDMLACGFTFDRSFQAMWDEQELKDDRKAFLPVLEGKAAGPTGSKDFKPS